MSTTELPDPRPVPLSPLAPPTTVVQVVAQQGRDDLDLDFILTQLRGTFDGRLEQLLALPADDPACAVHAAALDAINAALARVHDGTYGTCERCDGAISAARLEVVPTTTTCVPCNANPAGTRPI